MSFYIKKTMINSLLETKYILIQELEFMEIIMSNTTDQKTITINGNPGNPTGEAGKQMLERMNQSHYEVTGWALDFFEIKDGFTILDIGCGGGMTLKRLSALSPSGKLFGIDHSAVAVEESIKLNETLCKSGKIEISKASVESLPFASSSFDRIITVESFYFWPNPVENLKEVLRVLKAGGKFMLVADIYGKEGLSEETLENIKLFNLLNPTKQEFLEMFEKSGFMNIDIHIKEGTDWIAVIGTKK